MKPRSLLAGVTLLAFLFTQGIYPVPAFALRPSMEGVQSGLEESLEKPARAIRISGAPLVDETGFLPWDVRLDPDLLKKLTKAQRQTLTEIAIPAVYSGVSPRVRENALGRLMQKLNRYVSRELKENSTAKASWMGLRQRYASGQGLSIEFRSDLVVWMNDYWLLPRGVILLPGLDLAPDEDGGQRIIRHEVYLTEALGYELFHLEDALIPTPVAYVPRQVFLENHAGVHVAGNILIRSDLPLDQMDATRSEELGHAADDLRNSNLWEGSPTLDPLLDRLRIRPDGNGRKLREFVRMVSSSDIFRASKIIAEVRAFLRELGGPHKVLAYQGIEEMVPLVRDDRSFVMSLINFLEKPFNANASAMLFVATLYRDQDDPAQMWNGIFPPNDPMERNVRRIYPATDEEAAAQWVRIQQAAAGPVTKPPAGGLEEDNANGDEWALIASELRIVSEVLKRLLTHSELQGKRQVASRVATLTQDLSNVRSEIDSLKHFFEGAPPPIEKQREFIPRSKAAVQEAWRVLSVFDNKHREEFSDALNFLSTDPRVYQRQLAYLNHPNDWDAVLTDLRRHDLLPSAGLEERSAVESLAILDEAAQGPGVVVLEAPVLRNRPGLLSFIESIRGPLVRRLIVVGLEEKEVRELRERNPLIQVILKDDFTGLVVALVGLEEAERVTQVGENDDLAQRLRQVLPPSMTVLHVGPDAGLEELLRRMGVPERVLDQINASRLESVWGLGREA